MRRFVFLGHAWRTNQKYLDCTGPKLGSVSGTHTISIGLSLPMQVTVETPKMATFVAIVPFDKSE